MLKEFLVLVNKGFDEDLCIILRNGNVTLENLRTKLCQKLLTMNNVVDVFVMFASFSN